MYDKARGLGTPHIFTGGSKYSGRIGAAAVVNTFSVKRACQMGDDGIPTVYAAEIGGIEMALGLIQEGWYQTPGRMNGSKTAPRKMRRESKSPIKLPNKQTL